MFWPILVSSVAFWGIALAGALVLGRRYVRALEARVANDEELAELRSRVEALEVAGRQRAGIASSRQAPGVLEAPRAASPAALPAPAAATDTPPLRASEMMRKVPRNPRTLD